MLRGECGERERERERGKERQTNTPLTHISKGGTRKRFRIKRKRGEEKNTGEKVERKGRESEERKSKGKA